MRLSKQTKTQKLKFLNSINKNIKPFFYPEENRIGPEFFFIAKEFCLRKLGKTKEAKRFIDEELSKEIVNPGFINRDYIIELIQYPDYIDSKNYVKVSWSQAF